MPPPRPFIYIAALRRSGSTLLSELLTDFPRAFIFREPGFARGRYELKQDDAERFATLGIDLPALASSRLARTPASRLVGSFRRRVVDAAPPSVEQIGVKEIRHEHWQRYADAFPDLRAIVLGRDPRDIYLSMLDRQRKGVGLLKDESLTPHRAAELLTEEFDHQRDILRALPPDRTMTITYERLCTDQTAVGEILAFADSPLNQPGQAGGFNERNEQRKDEAAVHGGAVTTRRVERWRDETDTRRRDLAEQLFGIMTDYAAFWRYSEAPASEDDPSSVHA